MSNIQAAMKVADQIIFRIFDQRQFTAGEIDFTVKELGGEKVNLEENFDKILKLNENACVTADTNLQDLCDSSDKLVSNYCDQVKSLHERTENLLKLEEQYRDKETKLLAEAREGRSKRKQDREKDLESKLAQLDEFLKAEESDLERKYLLFEQNLRNEKR